VIPALHRLEVFELEHDEPVRVPVALEDGKLAATSHKATATSGDRIRRRRLVALVLLGVMDVRLDDHVRRHDPSIDPRPPARASTSLGYTVPSPTSASTLSGSVTFPLTRSLIDISPPLVGLSAKFSPPRRGRHWAPCPKIARPCSSRREVLNCTARLLS